MLILGSKSPRRQELIKGLDIPFVVKTQSTDETYPADLEAEKVPLFIAGAKADAFDLEDDDVLITADTVVIVDGKIYGKPHSRQEAIQMLEILQGRWHKVVTGVCIRSKKMRIDFSDTTEVHFARLDSKEIKYYVDEYQPFDKAGSYGVQEWIGYVAVDCMKGSYFNVMGLPIHLVYKHLKEFL